MIAIIVAIQMSIVAMNLGRSPGASCNQCEHGPPMIAIMATDDCERLHLVAAGAEIAAVMQAGRWKSPTMPARYAERLSAGRGAVAQFYGKRG